MHIHIHTHTHTPSNRQRERMCRCCSSRNTARQRYYYNTEDYNGVLFKDIIKQLEAIKEKNHIVEAISIMGSGMN